MKTPIEIISEMYGTKPRYARHHVIEMMEKHADQYKSQWQSTWDSSPHVEDDYDFSEPVLICHNIDKWNARGVYQHGAWYNDFDTENECFPTHWMPLPEYPQI